MTELTREDVNKMHALYDAMGLGDANEGRLTRALIAAWDREAKLRDVLREEHESNLWNAYNAGYAKDGKWHHMFMSDAEGLEAELALGTDDDAAIRAAIPGAAEKFAASIGKS